MTFPRLVRVLAQASSLHRGPPSSPVTAAPPPLSVLCLVVFLFSSWHLRPPDITHWFVFVCLVIQKCKLRVGGSLISLLVLLSLLPAWRLACSKCSANVRWMSETVE